MSVSAGGRRHLRLFVTAEHPCSYLPGRRAQNVVADPEVMEHSLYSQLVNLGFRRSGDHIYRPNCAGCAECRSLRIPVAAFRPNRSQQRTWQKNQDLTVRRSAPAFDKDHYHLFKRYLQARHPTGGMDETALESYLSLLGPDWSGAGLYELRLSDRLLAVAVVDRLQQGLSAVYSFFEPEAAARSLGVCAILLQIAEARRLGLPWVYLGYWVRDCRKMAYKTNFRPHEVFLGLGQDWFPVKVSKLSTMATGIVRDNNS